MHHIQHTLTVIKLNFSWQIWASNLSIYIVYALQTLPGLFFAIPVIFEKISWNYIGDSMYAHFDNDESYKFFFAGYALNTLYMLILFSSYIYMIAMIKYLLHVSLLFNFKNIGMRAPCH